jgi:hypothetical protein
MVAVQGLDFWPTPYTYIHTNHWTDGTERHILSWRCYNVTNAIISHIFRGFYSLRQAEASVLHPGGAIYGSSKFKVVWLCKQRQLLGNARNNGTTTLCNPFLSKRICKRASTTIVLLLETVFPILSVQSRYEEDNWAIQLVEDWQFSWALQGRLRRDGAIVELTVDKSFAQAAVTGGSGCRKLKKLHVVEVWRPRWPLCGTLRPVHRPEESDIQMLSYHSTGKICRSSVILKVL